MKSESLDLEQLVRSGWEEVGKKGASAMVALLAPAYIRHGSARDYNRDEWIALLDERQQAFPDNVTTIDMVVTEGSLLAYRWTAVGTHERVYYGVPKTGKRITVHGITIARFELGLITEEWASWDKASVFKTLGIHALF